MFNARSIANKISALHHLLYSANYDIYFVTETWLNDSIYNGLLDPKSQFTVLRNDRTEHRGGGVCALIRNRLCRVVPISISDEFRDVEVICCDVIAYDSRLRFFVLYRPPTLDEGATTYMHKLVRCLSQYQSDKYTNVIAGDLNLPNIDWNRCTGPSHAVYKLFLSFVIESSYTQLVSFPTRGSNILDIVLTTESSMFSTVEPDMPICSSDHSSIKFNIMLLYDSSRASPPSPSLSQPTIIKYKWYLGDFEAMESYLHSIDWCSVIHYNPSADVSWKAFLSILYSAIDMFVPRYRASKSQSRHYMHTSRDLSKCTVKKRRLWRNLKLRPHDSLARTRYRECVHRWRSLVEQQEICIEERIIETNNIGAFYSFVNKRISHRSGPASVTDLRGATVTDELDIANAFNDYFACVGTLSNNTTPPVCTRNVPPLVCIEVSEREVLSAIGRLKNNLSAGPDGLPPLLFKRVKRALAFPLMLMFNQLLSVACVPDGWKNAIITPVHKKGPKHLLNNYRPISITCVPCKLLERIVASRIYGHLERYNILCGEQHGFMRGRSTGTNLLECLNDWTCNIQNGYPTIVIYIDFSKAFDVVQHDKLFVKLRACGIDGILLQWITNWFMNRTFCTRINDLLSDVCNLLSGVIQGSVLGPLMFLIYINDIVELLARFNIKVKLFADDVKLYVKVVNDVDISVLQEALAALVLWADEWQLSISTDKCGVLHIGKGKGNITDKFYINSLPLPVVSSYRDLGITITDDLSPSLHINGIVTKAHQRANMIHRCFVSRNVNLLTRAYLTYVRPLLEHNSIIWSPHVNRDILLIERVQRRFTKRLRGLTGYSYDERLKFLNLERLELRRVRFDVIWCYKILFGLVGTNKDDLFELRSSSTRGHPYKLFKHFNSCSAKSSFFSHRVVNIWNRLPVDSIDFSSLSRFKRSLCSVDLSVLIN